MEPVLELTNATLVRGGVRVLDSLSLAIHRGEHTAILGPNGAGKSSFIRLLTFEDRPRLGENGIAPMRIFGEERWDVSALRPKFGVVTGELDHGFGLETSSGRVSGIDVATSGLLGSHGVFSHHDVTDAMRTRAREALARVDGSHLAGKPLNEMSAGERRRVLIARALVTRPEALVLDEPTTGLDFVARHKFMESIRRLAKDGTTIILVTHHVEEIVPEIARVILLRAGKIAFNGAPADALTAARLTDVFGAPMDVIRSGDYYHVRLTGSGERWCAAVTSDRLREFLATYPEYESTSRVDEIRAADYSRLDDAGDAYLDYTGACLYAASQIRAHGDLLSKSLLGNPHSASPASLSATHLVERSRRAVLDWFNARDEYTAVFTLNATGALKHVGESYPFSPGGRFLLTADNHNSVNGIREFAVARGATVSYVPLTTPELRIDESRLDLLLASAARDGPNLFAFPAQSNFTGVKHPLELVQRAHAHGWDVLLDAAAFVPTNRLDLQLVSPDFVCVSFYKMFGYPTGVGCLLVRKSALARLRRPWFSGGTVNFATVGGIRHLLSPGEAGFEDGTLNFLSIAAVEIGLRHLESIGIDTIQTRVRCLTDWVLKELVEVRHSNGRPMVRIYGPLTTKMRGGIVTMNLYDPAGHLLDYRRVEELAGEQRISLRTGCFCNPGAGEIAEGITDEDVAAALEIREDLTLARFLEIVTARGGKSAGAIRVSFGLASNFADADRFVQFVKSFRDQSRLAIGAATFDIESCRIIRDGS